MTDTSVPNHHAHYGQFAGPSGLAAALSMSFGRNDDARLVARLSGLEPGSVVIDLGCGPGVAARYAAKRGATVTGVDPAPVMLRIARLRAWPSRARFVEGTAEAIPAPDAGASIVWSIATVHHWQDIDAAVREVRRVLRAGGRFVAIERHTTAGAHGLGSHGWTDEQAEAFADLCRAHDFVAVRVEHNNVGKRSTVSVIATAP
jgi:ubiquinone/menaquinone biosynthesis C-methylase UbiE